MEEKTDDIVNSFRLFDDDRKSYVTIRGGFEMYLVKKRDIVFD